MNVPTNYILHNGEWCHPSRIKRDAGNMGAGGHQKPQQNSVSALDEGKPVFKGGSCNLGIRITFISFRKRLLDEDNGIAGCKPLRDSVSKSLRIDDADDRIEWVYEQCKTKHQTGTLVKIEILK